ncbi:MAG: hypothetical protein HS132_14935 [Planctomycetia bacterium]|nr:hypothetical protein [Planctomycetia bacterium]
MSINTNTTKEATVLYVDINDFEQQRNAFDAAWGLGERNEANVGWMKRKRIHHFSGSRNDRKIPFSVFLILNLSGYGVKRRTPLSTLPKQK